MAKIARAITGRKEPEPPPPVEWPALTVAGIIGGDSRGSVFINEQVLEVGETIDGVRVAGIARQTVRLQYKGEVRDLKVGGSTL
jgi:hypothetical protein